ncbi:MAG: hypothetical protein R3284_12245 [Rubricoccaceae bacterium]|nr:hypothetical protein [Rubricoccaceae bacterium]
MLIMTACSVQWTDSEGNVRSLGFIHYSVVESDKAWVYVHRTLGLNLRFTHFDGGFTLGYRKMMLVKPCNKTRCPKMASSGFLSTQYDGSEEIGAYLRRIVGADLGLAPVSNGFRLGYHKHFMLLGPSAGESVTAKIEFDEKQPENTIFLLQKEAAP